MTQQTTTLDGVRDAVLLWVEDITSRVIVLANSGEGARPRTPYAEVFVSQYASPTSEDVTYSVDGLVETVTSNTLLTVTLDIFGNNPMQDASKLMRSLYSQNRYKDLWLICGLSGIDAVTDLTALETGALKQRAQVSFTVYCTLVATFDSDYFENVNIDVEINDKGTESLVGGSNPREKAPVCFTG